MIKYQFVPTQPHLFSLALPVCQKLGEINDTESNSLITTLDVEDFNTLMNRNFHVWGVNIDMITADRVVYREIQTMGCSVVIKNKECFFIGPPVAFYDDGRHNVVLGIDGIDLPEFPSNLQIPPVPELRILEKIKPIERNVEYKILNQGVFDYKPAVEQGTELLKKYGIRAGSVVNLYGEYKEITDNNHEAVIIVACSNNRSMNPCVVKSFIKPKDEVEQELIEFTSGISLLGKQYSNYYMFKESLTPGKYLVGVFDFAAVLPQYRVDTSVYLEGTRDHHEKAGILEGVN